MVIHRAEHQEEFVAAQSCGSIAFSDRAFDSIRHLDQELVTGVMAQRIVDVFEVIEVDEHQCAL